MKQTRPATGSLPLQSTKMMGRTVWCESQTEHRFFSYLDQMPEVIYYQEQPVSIRYTKNKRWHSYHPDVLVSFRDGRSVLVEVKPCIPLVNFDNIIKYDAMSQRCEAEGWGAFIGDDRISMRRLLNHRFRPALATALRTELKRRAITLEKLTTIKAGMNLNALDVNAAFLQLRLVVESKPFLVRHAEPGEIAAIERVLRYFGLKEPVAPISAPAQQTDYVPRSTARRAAANRTRALHSSAMTVHPNAYNAWTADEEQLLLAGISNGETISELARRLGRKPGAIRWRLKKLNV
jgi:hypothetical protein